MRRAQLVLVGAVIVGLCACAPPSEPQVTTNVSDWRDEVIYQLLVDRFDNADPDNDVLEGNHAVPGDLARHQGGDWAGVTRRLDYLEQLGITALWISPIVRNVDRTDLQDGYHGYWASDFTRVNPRFGQLADLQDLVAQAHRRHMKVIVDVVTNHAGRVFYYDTDGDGQVSPGEMEPPFSTQRAHDTLKWLVSPPSLFSGPTGLATGAEPSRLVLAPDHFHRLGQMNHSSDSERELGDFPTGLRDLDSENETVIAALIDTYVHWVVRTDIDGFRLDAVPHMPRVFWARFASELRQRLAAHGKHNFLLVGEVFDTDPKKLASYTSEGGLDAVFDFPLKQDVIDGFVLDGKPAASTVAALSNNAWYYPSTPQPNGIGIAPWSARVAFAENHDLPRLRYWLDDPWAAELAMTIVFMVDAIPSVYYGVEQALAGGWDNASREPLWQTGFDTESRMYRHVQRLARIRRDSVALRRGSLTVRYASPTSAKQSAHGSGLLAWERIASDDRVLVALNGHPRDRAAWNVPTGFSPGTRLHNLLLDGDSPDARDEWLVADDGTVAVNVAPRAALILAPR